jgi:hypothetical protein
MHILMTEKEVGIVLRFVHLCWRKYTTLHDFNKGRASDDGPEV